MKFQQDRGGFTIVELLIVVVVIAILAAITIVSYNGISQSAKRSQLLAGVKTYITALEEYKVLNGEYPQRSGCLGANYPNDACWMAGASVSRAVDAQLDAALATVMSAKPTLETERFSIGIADYERSGLAYMNNDAAYGVRLTWYFRGINQDCGIPGAVRVNEGGVVSQCNLSLQAP